jgi:hypothetical protein
MEVPLAETAVRAGPVPRIPPPAKTATFSIATLNAPFQCARSALRATILPGDRYPLGLAIFQVTREISVIGGFVIGGFIVSVLHARNALTGAPVTSERGDDVYDPGHGRVFWPLVPIDAHESSLSRAPAISAAPGTPVSPNRSAWHFPSRKKATCPVCPYGRFVTHRVFWACM